MVFAQTSKPALFRNGRDKAMPVRYMGTKRSIATPVRDAILSVADPNLPVLDLFAGVGAVSSSLMNQRPIIVNDVLNFIYPLSVSRFKTADRPQSAKQVTLQMNQDFCTHRAQLVDVYRDALRFEDEVHSGKWSVRDLMDKFATTEMQFPGSIDPPIASSSTSYSLVTQYFSASYFSFRQAIDLDAMRFAIDRIADPSIATWAVSAWLATMSAIINAPGHTAQFLKPSSEELSRRIARTWRRDAWAVFQERLNAIELIGSRTWRSSNNVWTGTADAALKKIKPGECGAVYADPPYTRDDYSRFYHVYETAYLYDFPVVAGSGRTRVGRVTSEFCGRQSVTRAFKELKQEISRIGCPLILSYPQDGLLSRIGSSVSEIFSGSVSFQIHNVPEAWSRVGTRRSRPWRTSPDCIYVIRP